MSCEYEMEVTAFLDGELAESDAQRVGRHLETCAECAGLHERLAGTRDGLEALFRDELDASPAPPTAESLLAGMVAGTTARRGFPLRLTAVAAGLIAIVTTVVLWPGETAEASASVVVERAASRFDRFENVELWIRAELAGGNPADAQMLRLFVSPEHGVAAFEGFETSAGNSRPIAGVRGDQAWDYDAEKNAIVVKPFDAEKAASLTLGKGDPRSDAERKEDPFGLTLLSFGMVSRLSGELDAYDLDEVTGPFHRRVGRRCFRLTPKEAKDDQSSFLDHLIPTSITLTIDPTTDLVERIDYQIGLILVVLNISAEIAAVDQRLDPAMFDYRTHYGDDVAVVHEEK